MSGYNDFFLKFMEPFFSGIINLFKEIGLSLFQIFNVLNYIEVIKEYYRYNRGWNCHDSFGQFIIITFIWFIFLLIYRLIVGYFKYRHRASHQQALVEEIDNLNNEVIKLKVKIKNI